MRYASIGNGDTLGPRRHHLAFLPGSKSRVLPDAPKVKHQGRSTIEAQQCWPPYASVYNYERQHNPAILDQIQLRSRPDTPALVGRNLGVGASSATSQGKPSNRTPFAREDAEPERRVVKHAPS